MTAQRTIYVSLWTSGDDSHKLGHVNFGTSLEPRTLKLTVIRLYTDAERLSHRKCSPELINRVVHIAIEGRTVEEPAFNEAITITTTPTTV